MSTLSIHLALHGVAVLTVSILAGVFLHRAILNTKNEAAWHLLHSGGSARGILLIALAAIIHIPDLPSWQLSTAVWLMIFFTWTSMLAMIMVALSGERGFGWFGSKTNKFIYVLYVLGAIAVFPACLLLIIGLINAL